MANYATDILATTIANYSSDIADAVSNSNAILAALKKNGGVVPFVGGTQINQMIDTSANSTAAFYSGTDVLTVATTNTIDNAIFAIKQAAVTVQYSGLDEIMNSGKAAIVNTLEQKMKNAERSMKNLIGSGIYSDGTGFSGKQITGLQAAITATPAIGVYGAFDRSVSTFWRNLKSKGGGTDFAGTLDQTTICGEFNKMVYRLTRGTDAPKLIVCDPIYYAFLTVALQNKQQFLHAGTANAGFSNIEFMGIPVVMESSATGIPPTTAYFLNTDYLFFRPHAKRNMISLGDRTPVNQDTTVHVIGWAGNLTASHIGLQGVIQN
ncbi:phage major capsid protein [Variovorax sp. LG9.2]|uniref:phage major capsid protein n=1 Tax=Variovorax sp. LG9.2 TaxID=3048626 RepID=UPI002B22FE34|nr:phage major capsid protein [Variovorax sp. LG9.2]MEB0057311.1 phage major capsid protein [Variovorax sp. LG9.2]